MNVNGWPDVNTPSLSLRELVAPCFRRKTLLIRTFLAALGIVLLLGILVPVPYKSQMSVLVNRERHDPPVSTEDTTQMPSTSASEMSLAEITSEAQLLQSPDLLRKVVLATGLADSRTFSVWNLLHPFDTQEDKVARQVKQLAKDLKIENETNSNLIDVSYKSPDPRVSHAVLDSLATFYIEKHVAVHRPSGSFQFFADEAQRYQNALQESEGKLRDFGKQQGVAAPDVQRSYVAQQVAISVGQLNLAQQTVAADEQRINSDESQMALTPRRSTTQEASNPPDKLLGDLHASLLAAETRRTQLAMIYEPQYPSVQEADQEIAQTKAAIAEAEKVHYVAQTTDVDATYELLREDLAKTRSDLAAQRATAAEARRSIQNMQEQIVDLDQKTLTQQDLLRDAKANEESYLLYLSKREQERAADALDKTKIGNVSIAVPPSMPVLPLYSFPMVIGVAFGVAIILSLSAAYAADYLDTSFRTSAEVSEMLGVPIVVAIPKRSA